MHMRERANVRACVRGHRAHAVCVREEAAVRHGSGRGCMRRYIAYGCDTIKRRSVNDQAPIESQASRPVTAIFEPLLDYRL